MALLTVSEVRSCVCYDDKILIISSAVLKYSYSRDTFVAYLVMHSHKPELSMYQKKEFILKLTVGNIFFPNLFEFYNTFFHFTLI